MQQITTQLFREPLFQFLILGLVVFGVDRYVLENSDDPRRIQIDDQRFAELADIFEDGQGRLPTENEMQDLMVKWAQNEVLYREARSMGLDRGDEMIRQRLILKIRDILFNNVITELPPEPELEAWFVENRSAYDRPERLDFEQFLVADIEARAARELAADLGNSGRPEEHAGAFRSYQQRPPENLTAVFGEEHGRSVLNAEDMHWVAVESDYGWHLARITKRYSGEPVRFEDVRGQVAKDWLDMARKRELSAALGAITDQYEISYSLSADIVRETLHEPGVTAQAGTP